MSFLSCWAILGIQKTADHKTIRRAYAVLVKKVRPDSDPKGFMRLREAYEDALQRADNPYYWEEEEDDEENDDAAQNQAEENAFTYADSPEQKREINAYSDSPWQSVVPDIVLINESDTTAPLDLRLRVPDSDPVNEAESPPSKPEFFTQMDFVSPVWQVDRAFLQDFIELSVAEQMQQQIPFMVFFHRLMQDFSSYLINLGFDDAEELQLCLLTIFENNAYIDKLCFMSAAFKFNWATSLQDFEEAYRPDYSPQIASALENLLTRIEQQKAATAFLNDLPKAFRPLHRKVRRLKAPFSAWTVFVWRRYCCRASRREVLYDFLAIITYNPFLVQAIGEGVVGFLEARLDEYRTFIEDNKAFIKWSPWFLLVIFIISMLSDPIFSFLFIIMTLALLHICGDFISGVVLFITFHINLLVRFLVKRLKNKAG